MHHAAPHRVLQFACGIERALRHRGLVGIAAGREHQRPFDGIAVEILLHRTQAAIRIVERARMACPQFHAQCLAEQSIKASPKAHFFL